MTHCQPSVYSVGVASASRVLRRVRARRLLAFAAAAAIPLTLAGCIFSPFLRSSELKGSHDVEAKYTGLTGKSFAVIVNADRITQADFPQLVGQVATTVAQHLKDECDVSGWIPPEDVLAYQYKNPRWSVMRLDELSKELGVERLIFVEITEFRLTEPGNQYLWRAAAAAKVGVVESDGVVNDNFAFQEAVRVEFPLEERAIGPAQLPAQAVQVKIAKKLVDRIEWLFYDHEEKNYESDAD